MAAKLVELSRRIEHFDKEAVRIRNDGASEAAKAVGIAAVYCFEQLHALERTALAFPPTTPADAIAQLVLAHSQIGTLASSEGDPGDGVRALLEVATRALVVIAQASDFDLVPLCFQYMTEAERLIVRGEVPA